MFSSHHPPDETTNVTRNPPNVQRTEDVRETAWLLVENELNVELLDGLTREGIADRVEEIDRKYRAMDIVAVNVIVREHEERQRGVPLVLATARLFTDEGGFSGSGEQYGARAAFTAPTAPSDARSWSDCSAGGSRASTGVRHTVPSCSVGVPSADAGCVGPAKMPDVSGPRRHDVRVAVI